MILIARVSEPERSRGDQPQSVGYKVVTGPCASPEIRSLPRLVGVLTQGLKAQSVDGIRLS